MMWARNIVAVLAFAVMCVGFWWHSPSLSLITGGALILVLSLHGMMRGKT